MMNEEYSVAVFEDGSTEMIPKSWIQDYLQTPAEQPTNDHTYTHLQPFKREDSQSEFVFDPSPHIQPYANTPHFPSTAFDEIGRALENLTRLVVENKEAINRLQKCMDRVICIATGEPEPELNLSQPAETLNEFLAIEEHIKIKPNYDEMVQALSTIGGRSVESATRKIWNRLCSTQLASTICWTGANGKYCLKPLLLNKLVRDSVLVTHPQGKEADIQRATMLWFSHAQDRLRARKNFPILTDSKPKKA